MSAQSTALWAEPQIGDLCNLINGRAFKPTDWTDEGLPIVRIQNLNDPDKPFNRFDGEVKDKFLIENGDLLFAWSGTPGTSFGAHIWSGTKAVLNQHIFKVEYRSDVTDRDYFKLALNHRLDEFIRQAHGGVGLRHITKGKFERTTVPLPPLAEQKRIVEKLDSLTTGSTEARTALARVETLVEQYRQAVLERAYRPEWPLVPLEEVIDEGPSNGWSPAAGEGPDQTFTLRLSATTSGTFRFNEDTTKTIPHKPEPDSKYWLREGDILVQRANSLEYVGTTVEVCKLPASSIYPDLMMRIRIYDDLLRRFVVLFMNSPAARSYFKSNATGTAGNMPKISGRVLKVLPVPMPDRDEQRRIVEAIEEAFALIDTLASTAKSARERLDKLDRAVLAKAFRGELVPQDPNDEPASELLKRLQKETA